MFYDSNNSLLFVSKSASKVSAGLSYQPSPGTQSSGPASPPVLSNNRVYSWGTPEVFHFSTIRSRALRTQTSFNDSKHSLLVGKERTVISVYSLNFPPFPPDLLHHSSQHTTHHVSVTKKIRDGQIKTITYFPYVSERRDRRLRKQKGCPIICVGCGEPAVED